MIQELTHEESMVVGDTPPHSLPLDGRLASFRVAENMMNTETRSSIWIKAYVVCQVRFQEED